MVVDVEQLSKDNLILHKSKIGMDRDGERKRNWEQRKGFKENQAPFKNKVRVGKEDRQMLRITAE